MAEIESPNNISRSVEIYRELVKELTSEKNDESKIKKLMLKLGLKYSTERIDQLSQVLAFNPSLSNKGSTHDL